MLNPDRLFTDRSRKVFALANQEAQRFNHEYIGPEHILLGLVKEGSGVSANVLKNLDVDLRKVRIEVEKLVKSGPDAVTMGKLPQNPQAKKVIEYAIEEARSLSHSYVGTEHLLLGLLREQDPPTVAHQVLANLKVELQVVREEVLNLLGLGNSDKGLEGVEAALQKLELPAVSPVAPEFGPEKVKILRAVGDPEKLETKFAEWREANPTIKVTDYGFSSHAYGKGNPAEFCIAIFYRELIKPSPK